MTLAPGSFAWLLRHEVRLALRGTGPRTRWLARAGPLLLLAAIPTVAGIVLAVGLASVLRHDPRGLPAVRRLLAPVGAGVIALLVLMLSTALVAVQRTFHDRGDLDLLLAAPVPPARTLAAKAVGVTLTVAAPFVVLVAPFAVTSAVLGFPRWLGGLAMVAIDATLATALAIAVAGVLFDTIGPRRARVVVQLTAAVTGGMIFLLSQAQSLAPGFAHRLYGALQRPWSVPLDWPARAAIGQPVPLAAMVALAAAAAWGAAHAGARHLVAASDAGGTATAARTTVVRFRAGLTRIVVAKELRLIARDPELITQVALRLIYVIPMAALLVRGHGTDPGPAIAAAATAFAGLLASSLAWIVVAAEDAPDLLAAAPREAAAIARAKLVAATLVPLTIVGVAALAAAGAASGRAAGVTLAMGTIAAVSAALLQAWFGRPAPRAAFRRRQTGSFAVAVGEVVLAGAWSGTANLLVRGSIWALAPALLAALIMAGAIEARSADR